MSDDLALVEVSEFLELTLTPFSIGTEVPPKGPENRAFGDNVRGADLVVTAVHDGREAGLAIARMLLGGAG